MTTPLSWVFRACGIAPSGNRSDKYFMVLFVVALSISCFSIASRVMEITKLLEVSFYLIVVCLNRVAIVLLAVHTTLNRKSYLGIVRDLTTIDRELRELGISKYRPALQDKYLLIYLVIGSVITLTFSLWNGVFNCITTVIDIVLVSAPIFQEIVFASLIQSRFSALNSYLARVAANSNTAENTQLDHVFKVHACLQAVVLDVDNHYSFYNLIRFTARFLHSVITMYEYLMFTSHHKANFFYNRLIMFAVQSSYFICQAVVCHACSQEANRTVLLAHRVLQPDTAYSLWEEVGLFSTVATDNKVYFTIGGIFTLDRGLITNTALAALAYLIIAVQLKDINLFQNEIQNLTSVVPVNATNYLLHSEGKI